MNKKIIIVLLLLVAFLPLLGGFDLSVDAQIKQYFLGIGFLLLSAWLWKHPFFRWIAILLIMFWVMNVAISLTMWLLFDSQFNAELAMTVLSTNSGETLEFAAVYWQFSLLAVVLLFVIVWIIACLSLAISPKTLRTVSCLFVAIIGYKFAESAFHGRLKEVSFSMTAKLLPYTSLNNAGVFYQALTDLRLAKMINQHRPDYRLTVNDTGIDTFVIVIGESVRRQNVSLYGYHRDTTPNFIQQKDHLYVFEKAIAPAPVTLMSLSSTLTAQTIEAQNLGLLSDNIINLANQAGFTTYWYSRQGVLGQHESLVTLIAKNATYSQWFDEGDDSVLLPAFEKALADPSSKKKLIVLHTNGSHLSACNKYPESEYYFTDGVSQYEDCYDNSIRYMDKLMGQIFERLKNEKASVFYFSDHGQHRRIKRNGDIDYVHGAINPLKEAVDVPQMIWFSPALPESQRHVGTLSTPFALEDNYELISDWLGIEQTNKKNNTSPWREDYQPRSQIMVMDTHLNKMNYDDLHSENDKSLN